MEAVHVPEETVSTCKSVAVPAAHLDVTQAIVAFRTISLPLAVTTDRPATASLARGLLSFMFTEGGSATVAALSLQPSMLTGCTSAALMARGLLYLMLTNGRSTAFFALVLHFLMLTHASPIAVYALVLPPSMLTLCPLPLRPFPDWRGWRRHGLVGRRRHR